MHERDCLIRACSCRESETIRETFAGLREPSDDESAGESEAEHLGRRSRAIGLDGSTIFSFQSALIHAEGSFCNASEARYKS
jgi:hypothetical protein